MVKFVIKLQDMLKFNLLIGLFDLKKKKKKTNKQKQKQKNLTKL